MSQIFEFSQGNFCFACLLVGHEFVRINPDDGYVRYFCTRCGTARKLKIGEEVAVLTHRGPQFLPPRDEENDPPVLS